MRLNKIENFIYYRIYAILIELINPDTRIYTIDGTALRSSKFDGDAKKGKGTRIDFYTDYKLHCIASVTNVIIIFDITTANVYDNQLFDLIYEAKVYNLENQRLYGKNRYKLHVQWVLMSHLIDEYNKKKDNIKTRKYLWNYSPQGYFRTLNL